MPAHKVIFDTDPGVDDALALLFLHRHPAVDLVGITTIFGNAAIETTTRNALFLKQQWGIAAPVARGADRCLVETRTTGPWPTFIHGHNGLGDIPLPADIAETIDARPAARFIIDTVRQSPGAITLVAVGRMTNLALALEEAPDIASLVRQVVLMGGAFACPGNVTPAAEANIHGDPEAADKVVTAPWPVVLVGLDVTTRTVMTRARLDRLAAEGGAAGELIRTLSQDYILFNERSVPDGMRLHDACACAYLTDPALFTTRRGTVRVASEGVAVGMTIQKPDGQPFGESPWDGLPSQDVCLAVQAEAVLDLVHRTVCASRPAAG